jgi:oligoendopeptidase F
MNSLPATAALAARHPQPPPRWLPAGWRADRWEAIEPRLRELEERPIRDRTELERWLRDRDELDAWISDESARRNVAAARHTDDAAAERAHLEFQTEIVPQIQPVDDRLDRKYLAAPQRAELDRRRWEVHDRDVELAVRLFRPANVELEAREEELCVEYGRITGAMTVTWRGREWTLPELAPFAEEPDRALREETWRLAAARRGRDADALEELFDRMHALRARMASNAGFANYRDYMHEAKGRFDYRAEDCLEFGRNVERHVLPVVRRMQEWRRERLGLATLRPWDTAVDPMQAPAFQPFTDQAGQVAIAARLLARVHPDFATELHWMAAADLLDLEPRSHKRPGGFMDTFEGARVPFIFANSGRTHGDVETLLHETGHALHALAARELEPGSYRSAPLEFAEVASMGMEAMCMEHLGEEYPAEQVRAARLRSLEGIAATLPWVATVDGFQQRLYVEPCLGREARQRAWLELRQRFSAGVDWSGLEPERAREWHRQLHVFEVPFYYVEYAIAQIGALQLWVRYRRDRAAAVRRYREGLALGGSRPLPELFAAAGLRFDPRGESLLELMNELESAWRAEALRA